MRACLCSSIHIQWINQAIQIFSPEIYLKLYHIEIITYLRVGRNISRLWEFFGSYAAALMLRNGLSKKR
jgi:hypothetical protein